MQRKGKGSSGKRSREEFQRQQDLEDNIVLTGTAPPDEESTSDVDVDFELSRPNERHYHAVKVLLARHPAVCEFDPKPVTAGDLADIVCDQENIGTLVQNDEDDVFGAFSLLNLRQHDALRPLIQTLKDAAAASGDRTQAVFASALDDPEANIALLIKERTANLPEGLVTSSLLELPKDLRWTFNNFQADEEEEVAFYKFTHVLAIMRIHAEFDKAASSSPSKQNRTASSPNPTPGGGSRFVYPDFEDEAFLELAGPDGVFMFPAKEGEATFFDESIQGDVTMRTFVAISLIPFKAFPKFLENLSKLVSPPEGLALQKED